MKEKFIVGLAYFFAQKVRLDIAKNDGTIDHPNLTYEDIISSINKTSLCLCNDLRLKNYEAQVRFGTQVQVRDLAIFEKGGCGCDGTRRLKNY